MSATLVPWLGIGVVGAASCTTVSGGEDGIVISQSGCYLVEGGQSDGDEEDSDASTFIDVQASDVVVDGGGNTIDGTGSGEAIRIDGTHSNVTVRNVTLTDWATGIYVRDADAVTVEDVTVRSSGTGVTIDTTTNAAVERVIASNNTDYGVFLKNSPGGVLANLTADGNTKSNVHLDASDGATVRDATFTGGGAHGLFLKNSPNASVVRVASQNASTDGINVDSSANATVRNSVTRTAGQHGLSVTGSTNASVAGITAEDPVLDGIHVESSDGVVVRDSVARRAGQHGVNLADSKGNASIRNNTAANNTDHGFRIHHSDGSVVAENTARDNGAAGIRVSSELATVRENLFERNAVGIYLYTHSHVVENNTIRANGYGITLDGDNTTVAHNRVVGSATAGFRYVSGKDALIYDNLFNNSKNAEYGTDPDPSNRWNVSARAGTNVLGGSVVGGNAWLDPSGDGHSELWDDADADGFADTNYTVNGSSADEHPLNAETDALTVTPASQDYGSVNLTASPTREFVVESRARPDVTVDRLPIEGPDAAAFALESDPAPVTLSTGETVSVNVTFAPSATGLLSANLSVESDTIGVEGANVTLAGEGVDDTGPTADAGPNRTVNGGAAVSFDGTNSTDNVGIVTYEWAFGDGNTSTGAITNHTYTTPGTYTVTLTVSDAAGNTDTTTATIIVSDATAPTAEAGQNRSVGDGLSVSFDGTNSTDDVGIVSYRWDFGDGTTAVDARVNHTYATPGEYTVTLNVTDAAGHSDTDDATITVADTTAPIAEAGLNRTVDDGSSVTFDGRNSTDDVGIVSSAWEFGDGTTVIGSSPDHIYDTPGTYTATLNVSDAAGNTDTDTVTITVSDVTSPVAEAGPNRTVDEDTSVTFDGTNSTDNVGIVSHHWTLGDGTATSGDTVNHTYDTPGNYTVTLNTSDEAGNVAVDTATVTVSDATAPVVEAGPNRTVDSGAAVTFDGTNSTDDVGIVSYTWEFGDGNGSTGDTVNHTYDAPGTYTVRLTATDAAGNPGTDALAVTVDPSEPSDGDDANHGGSGGSDTSGGGGGPVVAEPSGEVTVTDLTLLNETAAVGDPVVVRVGLANPDPVRGRLTLALAANGSAVAERTVAVGMSASRTVSLRTTFEAPGRYSLDVNGAGVGAVEITAPPPVEPEEDSSGTEIDVEVDATDGSSASVSVDDVEPGREVPVEFGDEDPSTGDVSFESLSFTPTEGDPISMNVTVSRDPLPGAPRFDRGDNTSRLAHLRVEHSIANEDVDGAALRFSVSSTRLERLGTAPGDVALYRYQNGSWVELPTRIVGETDGGYAFVARSPGLSEFAAGAKQPQFELRTATVEVEEIRVGDEMRVLVRITNTGGADGTYTAKLLLDEEVVRERQLTIASNGTRQIQFRRQMGRPGTYRVLINDFPAGDVVVSNEGSRSTPASGPVGNESGLPLGLGAGVLSALAVIGGVLYRRY